MSTVGVAMLGAGNISGIYLRNITQTFRGIKLVGMYDPVRERAEAARAECPGAKAYGTMREALCDPEADIVLNLTRPRDHYHTTRAALEAGKHVYSEKPLGTSLAECEALCALRQTVNKADFRKESALQSGALPLCTAKGDERMRGYMPVEENAPYAKRVLWQVNRASSAARACENPRQACSFETVRRIVIDARAPGDAERHLPEKIACKASPDAIEALELSFEAEPGLYTLAVDVREEMVSNFCVVLLDGEEIGSFGVPYRGDIDAFGRLTPLEQTKRPVDMEAYDAIRAENDLDAYYRERAKTRRLCRFEIPFAVRQGGRRLFTLRNMSAHLNRQMMTFQGGGFTVERLAVLRSMDAYHNDLEFPCRPLIDLWGWMSMVSFEHPADRVTAPDALLRRSIGESFAWGANNLEFLPINADGVALDILKALPAQSLPNYRESEDTLWTADAVASVLRAAHAHGMLATFFLYCLHGAAFIAECMDNPERIALLEGIARRYGRLPTADTVSPALDGVITEAWFPLDAKRYTRALWRSHPGAFLLASVNDGSQYDVMNAGYSPAVHAYNAHWPAFDAQHTGYDHAYSPLPYPTEFYQREMGGIHSYLQACGQTRHLRKAFPRIEPDLPFGITNRTVSPDWILAQAQSFALHRFTNPESNLSMALCWEADEETMCPPEARRYVYAASQDPLRVAAAGYLSDTGGGGELALKRATRLVNRDDITRIRPRHAYPATTLFLQNRFWQLLTLPDRNYTILLADLAGTAAYYANGACVTVGMPYVATRFRDNGCQYLLSFRDIRKDPGGVSFDVYVHAANPMIYAPRIEMAMECGQIEVDGKPWRYCLNRTVLLPNAAQKQYHVRVAYGAVNAPSLMRTYARVEEAIWARDTLSIAACHPPWTNPAIAFEQIAYTAQIALHGWSVRETEGCSLLEQDGECAMVRLDAQSVRVRFGMDAAVRR